MATKQEVRTRIVSALNEKTGGQKPCALCGKDKWSIPDYFSVIPTSNDPLSMPLGSGSVLPLAPIVCLNCGNTHLVNLLILGFKDLSVLKVDDDDDKSKS